MASCHSKCLCFSSILQGVLCCYKEGDEVSVILWCSLMPDLPSLCTGQKIASKYGTAMITTMNDFYVQLFLCKDYFFVQCLIILFCTLVSYF